jgi:long-chain acyl-CoA synthetase
VSAVSTLLKSLIEADGFRAIDFSSLSITLVGGMATDQAVAQKWSELTHCPVTQGWGLTEASPGVTINLPGEEFNEAVGLPIPSTDVEIRDLQGMTLPIGEIGELCVRGPQVTHGYWRRTSESADSFWPGGWLRTGDAGRMDAQGYVFLIDRFKDVINVSGLKVYPNEVERIALTCPGVLEAAAVAQVDERSGEVVALIVTCSDPAPAADDIIACCRRSLTAYKVPKHVYFRAQLPKSAVGKILRHPLREELRRIQQE